MPLGPEPSRHDEQRGHAAERLLHQQLRALVAQRRLRAVAFPDAVVVPWWSEPIAIELKHASHYTSPPFDGHGLPVLQAQEYMSVHATSGIDTRLVVWEPGGVCWHRLLSSLEAGEHFDTSGRWKFPRRVYPLSSFTSGRWPR